MNSSLLHDICILGGTVSDIVPVDNKAVVLRHCISIYVTYNLVMFKQGWLALSDMPPPGMWTVDPPVLQHSFVETGLS